MIKGKVIAIDFDGTITKENLYPEIGELKEYVKEAINTIAKYNTICIWTCREGTPKHDAIKFLIKNGINYNMINESPYDCLNPGMRKIIADYYIDDRALFAEIDWHRIEKYFVDNDN